MRFRCILPAFVLISMARAAISTVPWNNGETLTYEVEWGPITAAEGTFHAKSAPGGTWDLSLEMKTRGTVEFLYPIRSRFTSRLAPGPWRSTRFTYTRNENGKLSSGFTIPDYANQHYTHTRTDAPGIPPEAHTFIGRSLEDTLSALYAMRRIDWHQQSRTTLQVYEKGKLRTVEAQVKQFSRCEVEDFPCQPLTELEVIATGKGKPFHMTVWLTDDARRVPLLARTAFIFGSFDVVLKSRTN